MISAGADWASCSRTIPCAYRIVPHRNVRTVLTGCTRPSYTFECCCTWAQGALVAVHIPYSYGWSIIALTALVKLATYPFTKIQVRFVHHTPCPAPTLFTLHLSPLILCPKPCVWPYVRPYVRPQHASSTESDVTSAAHPFIKTLVCFIHPMHCA